MLDNLLVRVEVVVVPVAMEPSVENLELRALLRWRLEPRSFIGELTRLEGVDLDLAGER